VETDFGTYLNFFWNLYYSGYHFSNSDGLYFSQQTNPAQPQYGKGHMSGTDMQLSQTRVKLAALQQQHKMTYYDPTFNRPKRQEQPVAEKIEQEKQQEFFELQKKEEKKKKDNIALKMSTHKAEMFRGASG
jgi:hypothetical protein